MLSFSSFYEAMCNYKKSDGSRARTILPSISKSYDMTLIKIIHFWMEPVTASPNAIERISGFLGLGRRFHASLGVYMGSGTLSKVLRMYPATMKCAAPVDATIERQLSS